MIDESDFEGTLVLEKLAEINRVDAFLNAVDSDDLEAARALMEHADIDEDTIEMVLLKITQGMED